MAISIYHRKNKKVPFFSPRDEYILWFKSTYVATGKVSKQTIISFNKKTRTTTTIWNDPQAEIECKSSPLYIQMNAQRVKWLKAHKHIYKLLDPLEYANTVENSF